MNKSLSGDVIRSLSTRLRQAEETCVPIGQLTAELPQMNLADAYAVQNETIAAKIAGGARVVGKKVGLTSKPMQDLLGVNEPDFGVLLDTMIVDENQAIDASRLIQPKAEGEIAFLLKKDLMGPGVTAVDVLAATDAVMAAIEIVDSRVRDWKIRIQDTVADNASSALFKLGEKIVRPAGLDLRLIGMLLSKNGFLLSTGAGGAVLGHPAASVAWLANKLAEFGGLLKAGQIVLSGALTAAVPVSAGDLIHVEFDRLGPVTASFI